jgi:hypothetical protein
MALELLKGRPVKSVYTIQPEMIEKWSGHLKQCSDVDLHRLIIKLLILGVLEE